MSEEKVKTNGGKIGAALGATAGALGTVLSNPVGRFVVLQSRTNVAENIQNFLFKSFNNYDFAQGARHVFETITNAVIAYPAILPIAGGLIAAGVGALVGRKISKARLKHKSLSTSNAKTM